MAFALALWASSVALAHHQADHTQGPPDQATAQSEHPTEGDDGDGAPNTPDPQGDNDNEHPSGNDKHEEPGGSGNMGWASSEPDQNTSGPERDVEGGDQPGNVGGADKLDQDGNNGCGNDDDFEDDNEGNCGGKKVTEPPPPPEVAPPTPSDVGAVVSEPEPKAKRDAREAPAAAVEVAPDELAFTGPAVNLVPLIGLTVWLLAAGSTLLATGRRRATR
ncbi:MAG: hypothetical protein M3135_08790 [Actinomycetota bacterium]|nr:hypothetical protein [Actinomycetota bacterium]